MVRAAAKRRARRCLMGIGGSATNDGGFGLARALGWEFLDRQGELIEHWTGLGPTRPN
jgi:glycerate kinase